MKRKTEFHEAVRVLVRPFIVVWGFLVYGVCVMAEIPVPPLLAWLISVVIGVYFGERAFKRFREDGRKN